jgi:hypothetical protein
MKLKFERCTAESLVEMFRHYFDTDLPEGGTHTIHQSLCCYRCQGVTKRCRLSWLTNKALMRWGVGGWGGDCWVSANGEQIYFGDLTLNLPFSQRVLNDLWRTRLSCGSMIWLLLHPPPPTLPSASCLSLSVFQCVTTPRGAY